MFGDPNVFCEQIAKHSNLQEGAKGVLSIIIQLYRNQDYKLTNKEFARIVGIPVPVISAVRGELMKSGLLETKNILSSQAKIWIEDQLMLKFTREFFTEFSPQLNQLSKNYQTFFKKVITSLERRPTPEYRYDQSRSNYITVIKRALLMARNGDVEGKKIVLLGDDDGLAIALAFLDCAREIFVIDIDPRVLQCIREFAEENGFDNVLHTQLWDIRSAFPEEWLNKYDVFEMDPPYTVLGFQLFVDRALSLINPEISFRGYISFGNKTPFDKWTCQGYLNSSGFVIEEFIPNFNRYRGATLLGNSSNLYVVSAVSQKLRRSDSQFQKKAIYTFDEVKTKNLPTVGYQIIAEMYGVKKDFLTDVTILSNLTSDALERSKLHTEEVFMKEYSPYGLSLIYILVESHCHIHTWPEHDYMSLDLFVCEAEEKAETFFKLFLEKVQPVDYHKFQFYRGRPPV
ncbi:MAG: adenosylmethionine decarboxylase [Candidatus Heimdallarchaeota archaeon]|nr:adenosylmethionine decarboxylase [Candidatus Heimdallarchaeota archaeon]